MWNPNNLDLVRVMAQDRMREAAHERTRLGHLAALETPSVRRGIRRLRHGRPAEVRIA